VRPENRAHTVHYHLPLVQLNVLIKPSPGREHLEIFVRDYVVPFLEPEGFNAGNVESDLREVGYLKDKVVVGCFSRIDNSFALSKVEVRPMSLTKISKSLLRPWRIAIK
jgi:hypothetical protein